MASGDRPPTGREPSPPALETMAAISGVDTPSMGACMMGYCSLRMSVMVLFRMLPIVSVNLPAVCRGLGGGYVSDSRFKDRDFWD